MARKFTELRARMSPERQARNRAETERMIVALPLDQLRRARELTQTTLADAMGVAQGEISKLENRTDCYVSTLRSYIEAMGGELEIVARFKDGQNIRITQFQALAGSAK